MAEIWGAAIAVGGAVMSAQAAKKKAAQDKKDNLELTREGAKYNAMASQFDAEQQYYYDQLGRQNKERGLTQFRKFSTMQNIDPNYTNDIGGIVLPNKPDAEKYFAEPEKAGGGGKKKKKLTGLLAKDLGLF